MYKTIHCDAPDYLTSFTFTSEIHTRLLWSASTYHVYKPTPRHELFHHSFTFSVDILAFGQNSRSWVTLLIF